MLGLLGDVRRKVLALDSWDDSEDTKACAADSSLERSGKLGLAGLESQAG